MPHIGPKKWQYEFDDYVDYEIPHDKETHKAWSRRNRKRRNAAQQRWRESHLEAHRAQCRKDERKYMQRKKEIADAIIAAIEKEALSVEFGFTDIDRRAIMDRCANGAQCRGEIRKIMDICYQLGFERGFQYGEDSAQEIE